MFSTTIRIKLQKWVLALVISWLMFSIAIRCFYVVSTDGLTQDFSYRKCLDNFIRGKYLDLVDEFIPKYFKPRTGRVKREQNPVLPPVAEEEKGRKTKRRKERKTRSSRGIQLCFF
ncbi:hypothetical protein ACOSQ3_032368 [Xanthoceras sorbifolium]